jgi:hypothetical protein
VSDVSAYLDQVRTHLHLDPLTERRVISELATHFQEKLSDLRDSGLAEEQASCVAIASFGEPKTIARLMYEAYGRGSWIDALIGCQPHLVVAALFATHLWRHPLLLSAAFLPIVVITLLAWRREAPSWLYSWMGYALLPLLIVTYFSVDPVARTISFLVGGSGEPAPFWHLAGLVGFFAFTLWLVASATVRVAKRDWIPVSLMLLPLPVLVVWIASVSQTDDFFATLMRGLEARLSQWDQAMACFCVTLAVATALFLRLRRRSLKAGAIMAVGIVGGALAVSSIQGGLDLFGLLAVAACFLLFLVCPFALHTYLEREGRPKEA